MSGDKITDPNELLSMSNVGKETLKDLNALGITEIKQLKGLDPDSLYMELQRVTGSKQDPCVRDVFAAIIHEAESGERLKWWEFTKIRKLSYRNNIATNGVISAIK